MHTLLVLHLPPHGAMPPFVQSVSWAHGRCAKSAPASTPTPPIATITSALPPCVIVPKPSPEPSDAPLAPDRSTWTEIAPEALGGMSISNVNGVEIGEAGTLSKSLVAPNAVTVAWTFATPE